MAAELDKLLRRAEQVLAKLEPALERLQSFLPEAVSPTDWKAKARLLRSAATRLHVRESIGWRAMPIS